MESRRTVLVALGANVAIAAVKFVAAAFTGSSAMLSEAIHSLVDSADQLLLMHGERRSQRPPDEQHPFGHGHELYFWTLVVSIFIFALGGGVSFYEGLQHALRGAAPVEKPAWSYAVLGAAALFESISWAVGWRQLQRERRGRSVWRTLTESKDPTLLTVVVEDSAALVGIALAFAGVFGSHVLRLPVLDAAASMAIGALLAGVAVLLARESRSLLVGESAGPEANQLIRDAMVRDPAVSAVGGVWTLQLSPSEILLNCEIAFREELSTRQIAESIHRLERAVRQVEPRATRIFIELRDAPPAQVAGAGR